MRDTLGNSLKGLCKKIYEAICFRPKTQKAANNEHANSKSNQTSSTYQDNNIDAMTFNLPYKASGDWLHLRDESLLANIPGIST